MVDEQTLYSNPVSKLISSTENDYKSDLSTKAELLILQEDFRKYENPFLCVLYQNKDDLDISIDNKIVDVSNRLVVSVSIGAK